MAERTDKMRIRVQKDVATLREELAQFIRAFDGRENDPTAGNELRLRLPVLRELLAELEEALERQPPERGELAALYGVSQAIGSSLDLQQVLDEVMDQIIHLTGAERSFLTLVDPETGELEFQAARNMDRETISSSSFEISRSIVKQVADGGEPVVTTNAQVDPRFKARESVVGYNLLSILCVPLRVRGRVTGVIYVDNRIRAGLFAERDLGLLNTFAAQAAVAIENARLFQSVASAKALMDNVFASITSGVITTDADDRITFFNRAARQILQVPETTAVGAGFAEVLAALEGNLRPLMARVREDGGPVVNREIETVLPGRGAVNLRANLSPLKDGADVMQGIAVVVDDLTEQRRLESRYQLFQRYLPPVVIERLPDDPHELRLGGQRQEITSMFADIRGFTDFSQHCEPERLVEVLNQYLDVGAKAVMAEEGTLDKFMGDAVVAFFNAPLPQSDHVLRAARAALMIQRGIILLHQRVPPDCQLGYGIGITVGDAVVGNVGTAQRLDYTAIGPNVNLARRLQEAAAPGQTLLASRAYQRIQRHVQARPLPPMQVEGVSEPVEVYELLGLK